MDQILKRSLEKIGIEITDQQKEQFDAYHKLLEEWNKVMNLTGITEPVRLQHSDTDPGYHQLPEILPGH